MPARRRHNCALEMIARASSPVSRRQPTKHLSYSRTVRNIATCVVARSPIASSFSHPSRPVANVILSWNPTTPEWPDIKRFGRCHPWVSKGCGALVIRTVRACEGHGGKPGRPMRRPGPPRSFGCSFADNPRRAAHARHCLSFFNTVIHVAM
jgi:hypothetical protein